jgi:DNA sulfur modification protein DndD
MQLLSLSVENFGVFRGEHTFDLQPMTVNGQPHHLILIRGHNGAGKSTLFQALGLALHGSLSVDDHLSHQQYNDFLLSRLHRYSADGRAKPSPTGRVQLRFQFVQSGQVLHLQIERYWQRHGKNVEETLRVTKDGAPLDVDPADYQTWINDMIPPGFASVCFFNAEQLNTLSTPEGHGALLNTIVARLLGLDTVQRLQGDLEQHALRRGGSKKAERLRTEVLHYQAAIDALEAQLNPLQADIKVLESQYQSLENALTEQERLLAAEGGGYAARRPLLQERLKTIQREMESVANQIRELSGELLPFSLAPALSQRLSQRLVQESQARRNQLANQVWQERLAAIKVALLKDELWQDLDISGQHKQSLVERLNVLFETSGLDSFSSDQAIIHNLAEPDQDRLQDWITKALHAVPQQMKVLGERLRALQEENRRIEADLKRAPDDQIIAPIYAEISRLQESLANLQQKQRTLNEQLTSLQFQRNEQTRLLQRTAEQLGEAQAVEQQMILAERSRLVLLAYNDALIRQQVAALERELVSCFNAICHKEHLLAAAIVDPESFSIQLQRADGQALSLNDLSAGERQLYALAVLWALRKVSGRQLPLAVDTPLARLDETHRFRLLHDYIPDVSDQVLLFATDAELDAHMLAQATPYLARVYQLDYDAQQEQTQVSEPFQGEFAFREAATYEKELAYDS